MNKILFKIISLDIRSKMGNSSHTSNERFLSEWTQLQQEGVPGALTNVWAKKENRAIQM